MVAISHNLAAVNVTFRDYARVAGKTPAEALPKVAGNLAHFLATRFRTLAPGKGRTRAQRLAALRAGDGLRIRPGVRAAVLQKHGVHTDLGSRQLRLTRGRKNPTSAASVVRKGRRLTIQALLAQREIAVRESARGFTAVAARYPRTIKGGHLARGRAGTLSRFALRTSGHDAAGVFTFAAAASASLLRTRARLATAAALADSAKDMRTYIAKKLAGDFRKVTRTGANVLRAVTGSL